MPRSSPHAGVSTLETFHPTGSLHGYRIPLQPDINPASANNPTMRGELHFRHQISPFTTACPNINERGLYIDVPELQEDLYYSSPPSASSENMIITPPMPSQDGFLGHPLPPVSPASWLKASNSPSDVWRFDTLISPTRSSESSRCGEKEPSIWNVFPGHTSNFYDQALISVNQPDISGFQNEESLTYPEPSAGCRFTSNSWVHYLLRYLRLRLVWKPPIFHRLSPSSSILSSCINRDLPGIYPSFLCQT
ncbi:hypothetical protein BDQ17DRAFT_861910 [Cyathus striatus]|nr:hypothetical protein BDQ17DRAFT_861910 [Cyathus striatus]